MKVDLTAELNAYGIEVRSDGVFAAGVTLLPGETFTITWPNSSLKLVFQCVDADSSSAVAPDHEWPEDLDDE